MPANYSLDVLCSRLGCADHMRRVRKRFDAAPLSAQAVILSGLIERHCESFDDKIAAMRFHGQLSATGVPRELASLFQARDAMRAMVDELAAAVFANDIGVVSSTVKAPKPGDF